VRRLTLWRLFFLWHLAGVLIVNAPIWLCAWCSTGVADAFFWLRIVGVLLISPGAIPGLLIYDRFAEITVFGTGWTWWIVALIAMVINAPIWFLVDTLRRRLALRYPFLADRHQS
jgi:hypothetical protein